MHILKIYLYHDTQITRNRLREIPISAIPLYYIKAKMKLKKKRLILAEACPQKAYQRVLNRASRTARR